MLTVKRRNRKTSLKDFTCPAVGSKLITLKGRYADEQERGMDPSADSKKSLMQPEVGIKALEMRKEDKTSEPGSSETMMRVGLNTALP